MMSWRPLLLAILMVACQPAGHGSADAGKAVDAHVMAFLSMARAEHKKADILESGGDLAGAAQAMSRLKDAPTPTSTEKIPEVEEVLADALARLAELRLRQDDTQGSESAIQDGLLHATMPSYFRGHLFEVYGTLEQARMKSFEKAGKPDLAAKAKEKAMQHLSEAVRIQESVIRAIPSDGGHL